MSHKKSERYSAAPKKTNTLALTPDYYFAGPVSEVEETMLGNLIIDDTVFFFQLPSVGSPVGSSNQPVVGVVGLLLAAFEAGLHEALMPTPPPRVKRQTDQQRIKDEAIAWVKTDKDMLSFGWYCDLFHIDTDRARKKILQKVTQQEMEHRVVFTDVSEVLLPIMATQ